MVCTTPRVGIMKEAGGKRKGEIIISVAGGGL
jgi:hypothetical protein